MTPKKALKEASKIRPLGFRIHVQQIDGGFWEAIRYIDFPFGYSYPLENVLAFSYYQLLIDMYMRWQVPLIPSSAN